MAVYKIFPNKDATLYSRTPLKNTGRDEVLEVSVKNSQDYLRYTGKVPIETSPYYNYDFAYNEYYNTTLPTPYEDISRSLISFSSGDISVLKNLNSSSFQANLRMYLAFAQNLSEDYSLECYPVTQSWDMGTGKFADYPYNTTGTSWIYTGQVNNSPRWTASLGDMSYLFITGGGSWNDNYLTTQSFSYTSNKDVNLDVTDIVDQWFSGSVNYGLIVKHSGSIELNTGSFIDLKFFSMDTHTIYPPCIEFKWDDSHYNLSPSNTRYVITNDFVLLCENNVGKYKEGSIYSFRLKARDKYPTRQFTTSSVYLNWKYLPEKTYWAIQDYKTEEMVIDFDTEYTKVSADYYGNYFNLYANGLQPERFYKILIKARIYYTSFGPLSLFDSEDAIYDALNTYTDVELDELPYQEVIVDNDLVFKIER
jgi:hypothetical protein